jgi:hypothetical protein
MEAVSWFHVRNWVLEMVFVGEIGDCDQVVDASYSLEAAASCRGGKLFVSSESHRWFVRAEPQEGAEISQRTLS